MASDGITRDHILAALAVSSEGDPKVGRIISTARALRVVRALSGDRTIPDEEVVLLLAEAAVASSCSVVFDHREADFPRHAKAG
jgi:hypothetical protein